MIPDIGVSEIAIEKDNEGNWDLERWGELGEEFLQASLPKIPTLDFATLEEIHAFNKISWLCVNFIENVEIKGIKYLYCGEEYGNLNIWEIKERLFNVITRKISGCLNTAIDDSVIDRTNAILGELQSYAEDNLKVVTHRAYVPSLKH